jgi:hypothetical protein
MIRQGEEMSVVFIGPAGSNYSTPGDVCEAIEDGQFKCVNGLITFLRNHWMKVIEIRPMDPFARE